MITTVLFDLDGTLLPMDQEGFTRAYFRELAAVCAPLGYAPEAAIDAVWAGTKAMVTNDGTVYNRERFWDTFAARLGEDVRAAEARFDAFYEGEFHRLKAATAPTPLAGACVDALRRKGYRLVLATNPLFPAVAVQSRLAWAGVDPAAFVHITHYGNSHFCKPNPAYYREILDRLGATPEACLMVGNNVEEDMVAATLGLEVFLVTDCLEGRSERPATAFPHGSLAQFAAAVQAMPSV